MYFKELITDTDMLKNLTSFGFTKATTIQEKTIPLILEKKDIIAKAKTGSGKTLAFGLPILLDLDVKNIKKIDSLIITPTRELANQVSEKLRKFAKFKSNIKILTLTGGISLNKQTNSLQHGAHIVVGTPGRIVDHLSRENIDFKDLKTVVLDEADKMLDMGFSKEINYILSTLPTKRQTLLFSATFSNKVKKLSFELQDKDREEISIEESIDIQEINLLAKNKQELLLGVISKYQPASSIIFTNTKATSLELEEFLDNEGYSALCINSDLEQIDRDETLIKFTNESCNFLIATDVASRGLDIKGVELVLNYDIPTSNETYTHRIGRTARQGAKGTVVNFKKHGSNFDDISLHVDTTSSYEAINKTICIAGGKKNKLRPGDIVGALIKEVGLKSEDIGVITVTSFYSYVAIPKSLAKKVFTKLKNCTIKAKRYKVWLL